MGHRALGKQEVWEVWEDGEEIFPPTLPTLPHPPHPPHPPHLPTPYQSVYYTWLPDGLKVVNQSV